MARWTDRVWHQVGTNFTRIRVSMTSRSRPRHYVAPVPMSEWTHCRSRIVRSRVRLGLISNRYASRKRNPLFTAAEGPAAILLHEDRASVRDNYEQPGAGVPGCHLAPD